MVLERAFKIDKTGSGVAFNTSVEIGKLERGKRQGIWNSAVRS